MYIFKKGARPSQHENGGPKQIQLCGATTTTRLSKYSPRPQRTPTQKAACLECVIHSKVGAPILAMFCRQKLI